MTRSLVLLVLLCVLPGAALADGWSAIGDLRAGYFENARTARSGARSTDGDYQMRLRAGAERAFGEEWRLRVRLAGRYSTEQERHDFYLRGYAPTASGLEPGQTTFDTVSLLYAPAGQPWSLRAGRLQTSFALMGVASKGLDRDDSSNVGVTWTDGLHYTHRLRPDWQAHVILQHNHRRGPGSTTRPPLDFRDSAARTTLYAGLEATQPSGPWVQRGIGLSWARNALASEGTDETARDDYLALTARAAASWNVTEAGTRFMPAAEIGYAPKRPRATVTGSGDDGRASGFAWQSSLNLYDILPGHHLGAVYGRVGAGWLLSSSFRGNDRLAELRYQWRMSRRYSFEARYRLREEIRLPAAAQRARRDRDFYLRLTARL